MLAYPSVSAAIREPAIESLFIGSGAGKAGITGLGQNVGVGKSALGVLTTGEGNTAIGSHAMEAELTGLDNTALGYLALHSHTGGSNNTAIGRASMGANITGANNTAVGRSSIHSGTAGDDNTAVGYVCMYGLSTGSRNTGVGDLALNAVAAGSDNTAVGYNAAVLYTGSDIVAVGKNAAALNVSGTRMTAIGRDALINATGNENTAVGFNALDTLTTGTNNTAVGSLAGFACNTTGSNTYVGRAAGSTHTGGSSTFIGAGATTSVAGANETTVIGAGATADGSAMVVLGSSSVTLWRSGTVGLTDLGVSDTFPFKRLYLKDPAITKGAGTGFTLASSGDVRRLTYKCTTTFASFAAAALTGDFTIATLPAKARIVAVYADTTTKYIGGAVSAATLRLGSTAGGVEVLASHDVFTAAVTKGLADADLGTSLTRAAAIQGGYMPSFTATTALVARITTTTANTNALTQGSTTWYIEAEVLP